ncbi:MAG: energy-coupled thiamine transporter ThiT [Candidatus Bathyarchaeota archaeon]|nr:energy-coupled thiamine transporter ThiT [Candidatus Termiticorpusculum sp.]
MNTTTNQIRTKYKNPKILAEAAIFIALATALSQIVIYVMPQGGSITLASMVPIIWLALRRGPKVGIATGVIYGIIQFMLLPYAIDPLQVLFDYPLAFAALGLAAFFPNKPILGATVAITGRFLMHFTSGAIWWAPIFAPSINPIAYSSIYNGSYLLPELVISGIMLYMLQKSRVLKVYL